MLIFSTCKTVGPRERNTVLSCAEEGVPTIVIKGGVETNEWGTPLVNSMVGMAAAAHPSQDLFMLVNADIILFPGFLKVIERVKLPEFLLIGQRLNWPGWHEIDFSDQEWASKLKLEGAKLEPPCGIDYFVFTKDLWRDMPPLAVGRFAWDQVIVYDVLQRGIPVLDATQCITAVHQDHPAYVQRSDPECQENFRLAREWHPTWTPWDGWVSQATYRLPGRKLWLGED